MPVLPRHEDGHVAERGGDTAPSVVLWWDRWAEVGAAEVPDLVVLEEVVGRNGLQHS